MSLLWSEGFECTSSTLLELEYYGYSVSSCLETSIVRTGLGAYKNTTNTGRIYIPQEIEEDEVYILGSGVYLESLNSPLFILPGGGGDNVLYITNGVLRYSHYTLNYTYAYSDFVFAAKVWYYIELKFQISNATTITQEARVNGETVFTVGSGGDNVYSGYGTWKMIQMGNGPAGQYFYLDDMYLCDTNGSANNDFLGPIEIHSITPNGNGTTSDWDGSDGNQVDNYQLVDETTPSASDYIEAQNTNEVDLFTYSNLAITPSAIKGLKVKSWGYQNLTNVTAFRNICRTNSTNYESSDLEFNFDSQTPRFSYWDVNPDTTSAWTVSEINALELGIKVTT